MNTPLPFTNWSLKQALDNLSDNFDKARVRIIFTILIFSLLKSAIAIVQFSVLDNALQVVRASVAGVLYLVLVKLLLSRPEKVKQLAHTMLIAGLLIIWTSIFIYAHKVNLVTTQFILMVVLSSFYTLGTRLGIVYSIFAALPAFLLFVLQDGLGLLPSVRTDDTYPLGVQIIIVLNFASIVVAHHLFYIAFHANIVEKEQLNKQLEISVAEARKFAASRSNFLSTMSHELRTPLNSVVGMAELLIDDQPNERQKENLQILHSSAIDLLTLINNVLDFNKMDSSKVELESVPLSLHTFMTDVSRGFRKRAEDKRLQFNVEVDEQLTKIHIATDPARLAQVMYNLLGNALKFTEEGSIGVTARCMGNTGGEVTVLFEIADTGLGIEPERQAAIFEVFTQATIDTTQKYGGSGLGLAIVRQTLSLFGSDIAVESIPGKGSKFFFTIKFPIAQPKSAVPSEVTTEKSVAHLRILVAEDDKINRLIVKKQLARLNLDADVVENGQLAYEACQSKKYDVLLLDLHMPVMNGYETIKLVRTTPNTQHVYVVAFTAAVTEQEQILTAGFDDYLYKPVQLTELKDKLERAAAKIATLP